VFPLCLGGNVFGWTAGERQSFEVLDAYAAAGGRLSYPGLARSCVEGMVAMLDQHRDLLKKDAIEEIEWLRGSKFDYPRDWVKEEFRFWTEQYLLQAFLAFNSEFEVLIANSYLSYCYRNDLKATFPSLPELGGGSFWMRRKPRR
jgi:hypothetical protein